MENKLPIIGISAGDPAGIGAEITVKALEEPGIYEICRPVVIGDEDVIDDAINICGNQATLELISRPQDAEYKPGVINLLDMAILKPGEHQYGKETAAQGNAAFQYVAKNISLAMSGDIDATVTAPINKAALNLAGHHFAGHTEIYAILTGTKDYAMMLADGNFRVIHVSTHVSLREACDRVQKDRIIKVINLADESLRKLGINTPRIAVAGLNPHAGEGGLFGREEIDEIIPAIKEASARGIEVSGPLPPDTVFSKMAGGAYDIVVVMYHDQGHIPIKMKGFAFDDASGKMGAVSGVNVTLGLPVLRVSVDHGTAFEIAGKGVANAQSMLESIKLAAWLARKRV